MLAAWLDDYGQFSFSSIFSKLYRSMYCVCNIGIKKPLELGIEYTGLEMPCLLAQPINVHVYTHICRVHQRHLFIVMKFVLIYENVYQSVNC